MKQWVIPVSYEMYGTVTVGANTLEEALETARTDGNIPLPYDAEYLDGSWNAGEWYSVEEIRNDYNDGQEDDPEDEDPEEDDVATTVSSNEFVFTYNPSEAFRWDPDGEKEEEHDPDEMFGFLFSKEETDRV